MSFDQIVDEIKRLPREQQVRLVDQVIETMGEHSDPEMDREHIAIIEERMRNSAPSIPGDEVLRRVRERLKK